MDIANESSFTIARMQLIIDASKWIVSEAESADAAVTRIFNKARAIEDKLLPWIQEYTQGMSTNDDSATEHKKSVATDSQGGTNQTDGGKPIHMSSNVTVLSGSTLAGGGKDGQQDGAMDGGKGGEEVSFGGNKNLPYFFQGLDYSRLNPNDAETHGVSAVCRELQLFSDGKLVTKYPIATTFLVRAIIEQAIVYYSKKHNIQGQNKLIWENIKSIVKLSNIIDNYKRNLPNYITDATMRQYFMKLFDNYEDNVDPLNWVVHKPSEFQLDTNTLIELPKKGLLTLINFMLL